MPFMSERSFKLDNPQNITVTLFLSPTTSRCLSYGHSAPFATLFAVFIRLVSSAIVIVLYLLFFIFFFVMCDGLPHEGSCCFQIRVLAEGVCWDGITWFIKRPIFCFYYRSSFSVVAFFYLTSFIYARTFRAEAPFIFLYKALPCCLVPQPFTFTLR